MKNQQSTVRFDHREIAVVFSLFIFVSLLMFTVGILVGKGLQQAKYEGQNGPSRSIAHHEKTEDSHDNNDHADAGTSITTGHDKHEEVSGLDKVPKKATEHGSHSEEPIKVNDHDAHEEHASHHEAEDPHAPPKTLIDEHSDSHREHKDEVSAAESETESSLDLVPAHPKKDRFAALDEFPKTRESEKILKDPKMVKLLEGGPPSRSTASISTTETPKSFASGKFTVQVGSYPNQLEAIERVGTLKKQGFPFAYYSANKIEGKKGEWFRVWLGYFPNESSAKQGGELLVSRGEVTSYFIRKSEKEG